MRDGDGDGNEVVYVGMPAWPGAMPDPPGEDEDDDLPDENSP